MKLQKTILQYTDKIIAEIGKKKKKKVLQKYIDSQTCVHVILSEVAYI